MRIYGLLDSTTRVKQTHKHIIINTLYIYIHKVYDYDYMAYSMTVSYIGVCTIWPWPVVNESNRQDTHSISYSFHPDSLTMQAVEHLTATYETIRIINYSYCFVCYV
jgi:hypothetical protein